MDVLKWAVLGTQNNQDVDPASLLREAGIKAFQRLAGRNPSKLKGIGKWGYLAMRQMGLISDLRKMNPVYEERAPILMKMLAPSWRNPSVNPRVPYVLMANLIMFILERERPYYYISDKELSVIHRTIITLLCIAAGEECNNGDVDELKDIVREWTSTMPRLHLHLTKIFVSSLTDDRFLRTGEFVRRELLNRIPNMYSITINYLEMDDFQITCECRHITKWVLEERGCIYGEEK